MGDTERAAVVAAATADVLDKTAASQFTAEALAKELGCRVDDVELDFLATRGVLEPVAKYVYQVVDPAFYETWVAAKLDQRERAKEPSLVREPDPVPDETLVLPLADAILKYLGDVPEEQRELVLRAAVKRVTEPPPLDVPGDTLPAVEEEPADEFADAAAMETVRPEP